MRYKLAHGSLLPSTAVTPLPLLWPDGHSQKTRCSDMVAALVLHPTYHSATSLSLRSRNMRRPNAPTREVLGVPLGVRAAWEENENAESEAANRFVLEEGVEQ